MTAAGAISATRRLAHALGTQSGSAPLVWFGGHGDDLNLLALLSSSAPNLMEQEFVLWDVASHHAFAPTDRPALARTGAAPILIVESLPDSEDTDRWDALGDWVRQAKTVICAGTEAAYGGTLTPPGQASRLTGLCRTQRTPLIKLPGIPVPPHHFVGTLSYLQFVGFPRLDAHYRPELYYSDTVCSTCERRGDLDAGRFAASLGEPGCLLRRGCRGPVTHNTCSSVRWNGGVNWCVGAGGPCTGCAEPGFPDHGGLGLYGVIPGDAQSAHSFLLENFDRAGKALVGLTALGIGLHIVRNRLERRAQRREVGRSTRRPPELPGARAPKSDPEKQP